MGGNLKQTLINRYVVIKMYISAWVRFGSPYLSHFILCLYVVKCISLMFIMLLHYPVNICLISKWCQFYHSWYWYFMLFSLIFLICKTGCLLIFFTYLKKQLLVSMIYSIVIFGSKVSFSEYVRTIILKYLLICFFTNMSSSWHLVKCK